MAGKIFTALRKRLTRSFTGNGTNEYRAAAENFIAEYPLTSFLGDDAIDRDTALLREGVKINVIIAGFGRAGREIFLASIANNQFMSLADGEPRLSAVQYHIFDKSVSERCLFDTYYRYKRNFRSADPEKYLPLPLLPSQEHFYRIDPASDEFAREVGEICGSGTYNFIVAATDSESENVRIAKQIFGMRGGGGFGNLTVFVFAKSGNEEELGGAVLFGCESSVLQKMRIMASVRKGIYKRGRNDLDRAVNNGKNDSRESDIGYESSLYGCLSLRFKLNLMGLDFADRGAPALGISREEYMKIYAGEDAVNLEGVDTDFVCAPYSKRSLLAIQEHHRWNSFMLTRGFVPSSIGQIRSEIKSTDGANVKFTNGKDFHGRRHGNITTPSGLVAYRRIIAERDGMDERDCDVIKYDYQLLDGAYELLASADCKIVKMNTYL